MESLSESHGTRDWESNRYVVWELVKTIKLLCRRDLMSLDEYQGTERNSHSLLQIQGGDPSSVSGGSGQRSRIQCEGDTTNTGLQGRRKLGQGGKQTPNNLNIEGTPLHLTIK